MHQRDDIIGPYSLVRTLGDGTLGEVWLAAASGSPAHARVALKLPLGEEIDTDKLRQEAVYWVRAAGHANIVPFIGAEIVGDQVVIASEYVLGSTLGHFLASHKGQVRTARWAASLMEGVLSGLQRLHDLHVTHRNLKPDNVLLDGDTPRLIDFGLVGILRETARNRWANDIRTAAFLAPEIFYGTYSPQSDIWSAGVILYQMLAEYLPFVHEDLAGMTSLICGSPAAELPSTVPQPLRAVVERALAKDTKGRYPTASAMRADLLAFMESEAIPGRIASSIAPARLSVGTGLAAKVANLTPPVHSPVMNAATEPQIDRSVSSAARMTGTIGQVAMPDPERANARLNVNGSSPPSAGCDPEFSVERRTAPSRLSGGAVLAAVLAVSAVAFMASRVSPGAARHAGTGRVTASIGQVSGAIRSSRSTTSPAPLHGSSSDSYRRPATDLAPLPQMAGLPVSADTAYLGRSLPAAHRPANIGGSVHPARQTLQSTAISAPATNAMSAGIRAATFGRVRLHRSLARGRPRPSPVIHPRFSPTERQPEVFSATSAEPKSRPTESRANFDTGDNGR